jgi:class 3 adenylate cyclase
VALLEDVLTSLVNTFKVDWNIRDGQVIPEDDDVTLKNGAVKLEAVFLYADLWDSTELALKFPHHVAARIVKAYLSTMAILIKRYGGEIRSFDGDRVMGMWLVGGTNTAAAECALHMKWAVDYLLRPLAEEYYPALAAENYLIRHCAGIDSSDVLVVKAGVRNDNDLVFVGRAPNFAAKLSAVRDDPFSTYVTADVRNALLDPSRYRVGDTKTDDMWTPVYLELGGINTLCYKSNYYWRFT